MLHKSLAGQPPRITFTHDFHELVRGDLSPGRTVRLRYDPLRIVPKDENYTFGDPNRPIVAHAAFRPSDAPATLTLHSPSGPIANPDIDMTGAGDMLIADLAVPDDAAEVTLSFTYQSPVSGLRRDDDDGRNFHFGFTGRQFKVLAATVAESADSEASKFSITAAAVPQVDRVVVRLGAVSLAIPKSDLDLVRTERTHDGWREWELTGVAIPRGTIARFKLYYWIDTIRYKDDNNGLYYLAPQPTPERVPPPPKELAQAARAWRE